MEDHKEESVVIRRDSIQDLKAHMSDQDFKQKLSMYIAFGMEFYRVIMGSFIVLFVSNLRILFIFREFRVKNGSE